MKYQFYFLLVYICLIWQSCSYSLKITKAKNKVDQLAKQYPEIVKDSQIIIVDTFISKSIVIDTIISCDSLQHYIQKFSKGTIEYIPINNTEYRVITRIEPDTTIKKYLVNYKYIQSQNENLYKELQKVSNQYNSLAGQHKGIHEYYKEKQKELKIYRTYFFLIIVILLAYSLFKIYTRLKSWNVTNLFKNMLKQ